MSERQGSINPPHAPINEEFPQQSFFSSTDQTEGALPLQNEKHPHVGDQHPDLKYSYSSDSPYEFGSTHDPNFLHYIYDPFFKGHNPCQSMGKNSMDQNYANHQHDGIAVPNHMEPSSDFISNLSENISVENISTEISSDQHPHIKRYDNYIFKRPATLLKEILRKHKMTEASRKDLICRNDFVILVLCRLKGEDKFETIIEEFLLLLQKELEKGNQAKKIYEYANDQESIKKEISLIKVLKKMIDTVKAFAQGELERSLDILYRKGTGLKRPNDLERAKQRALDIIKA